MRDRIPYAVSFTKCKKVNENRFSSAWSFRCVPVHTQFKEMQRVNMITTLWDSYLSSMVTMEAACLQTSGHMTSIVHLVT